MTTIHIPGIPPTITQQQKGVRCVPHHGSMLPVFYKKKAYRDAERYYLDHIPRGTPYSGAVGVRISFQWPWRSAEPKKNKAAGWRHKNTKPDCDNICKLVIDMLEKQQCGISHDAQIAELTVVKTWGDEAYTRISVWSLDAADAAPASWVDRYIQDKASA